MPHNFGRNNVAFVHVVSGHSDYWCWTPVCVLNALFGAAITRQRREGRLTLPGDTLFNSQPDNFFTRKALVAGTEEVNEKGSAEITEALGRKKKVEVYGPLCYISRVDHWTEVEVGNLSVSAISPALRGDDDLQDRNRFENGNEQNYTTAVSVDDMRTVAFIRHRGHVLLIQSVLALHQQPTLAKTVSSAVHRRGSR